MEFYLKMRCALSIPDKKIKVHKQLLWTRFIYKDVGNS